uniref:SCP domain-containing protein n=1 Tax=Ursus americanus TaxID=9643 RepID=A0A452SGU5_URSAM
MGKLTGKEMANRWYSEIKKYNFQQPDFTSRTGHFIAMVWKMGMGKAPASEGSSFMVARYLPAGNVVNYATLKKMSCLQRRHSLNVMGRWLT